MIFRWILNYLNSEAVQQRLADSRVMRVAARLSVSTFYTVKSELERLKLLELFSKRGRMFLENYKKQYREEMKKRLEGKK